MKTNEWLDTDGRVFNNRGLGFKTDPANPSEIQLDLDNEDPFSPNKQCAIQLSSLKAADEKAFNRAMCELNKCEEFQNSTLQLCPPEEESVIIKSCDVLQFNREIRLCFVGQDFFNENGFVIRATKDSVVLKPNKKYKEHKNPLDLLNNLKKQIEDKENDISHLFKNGDDYLNC